MKPDCQSHERARIACLTSDAAAQDELTTIFAEAGYTARAHSEIEMADIGVVDLREREVTAKQANTLTAAMRKRSPECAILYLVDPGVLPKSRTLLRRSGEILPTEDSLAPAVARCRQILRLRNLAEETGERLKSLAGMSRLAEFPPIETPTHAPKILVAGPPGPYALTASAAVRSVTGAWTGVISPGQSIRAIEAGEFDCAIFLPNAQNSLLQSLGRSVQRNPRYADLAIIHIARHCEDIETLSAAGAREFLLVEHIEHDLAQRITTATRRARLSAAMRRFLNACMGDQVCDPASGAFTTQFFAIHGARLCGRADQTRRPFTLSAFKLTPKPARGATPKLDHRALHQAVRLINRVTRASDAVVRLSPDCFAVATPATNDADASRIAARIDGVLGNTLFRDAGKALFSVDVRYNTTARTPGACVEEAVAAALTGLQERPRGVTTSAPG